MKRKRDLSKLSDYDLVGQLLTGGPKVPKTVWEIIFERYRATIVAVCNSFGLPKSDWSGVIAEAFMMLKRTIPTWYAGKKCSLRTAIRRKVINAAKRIKRESASIGLSIGTVPDYLANDVTGNESGTIAKIDIRRALAALTKRERSALFYKHELGLSYREIGPLIGCSHTEVGRILGRAILRLKQLLQ